MKARHTLWDLSHVPETNQFKKIMASVLSGANYCMYYIFVTSWHFLTGIINHPESRHIEFADPEYKSMYVPQNDV